MRRSSLAVLISILLGIFSPAVVWGETLNVLTTVFPAFDFAREVGGDAVSVELLLPPGTDTHAYEPTPKDIIRIGNTDLLIITGGEGDLWVEKTLLALGSDAPRVVALTELTETVTEEHREGMDGEAEEDPEVDEHVWTAPARAMEIVSGLADVFSEIIPDAATQISENTAAYRKELETLDDEYRQLTSSASGNLLIFGDRFPFRYLTDEFELDYYAAFPGCSSEVEPSAETIAFLIDRAAEEEITVILYTETSNHRIADAIAQSVGAESLMLHSCHTVSSEMLADGVSYLDLMRNNEMVLDKALNRK